MPSRMKLTKNPIFLHYFSKSMGILLFVLKCMFISLLLKMINGFSWSAKIMASPFNLSCWLISLNLSVCFCLHRLILLINREFFFFFFFFYAKLSSLSTTSFKSSNWNYTSGLSNLRPTGYMRPAKQLCVAHEVIYFYNVLAESVK